MCTDGDPAGGSCGCIPTDVVPVGNDPFCRYIPDDASWPGLLEDFSVLNREDLFLTQFNATQRLAMLGPRRSMVGPTIFESALTAIPVASTSNPPGLSVVAMVSKKPVLGDNVDLQLYMTSRDTPAGIQPLNHDFVGQARLNDLVPGTPTPVNDHTVCRGESTSHAGPRVQGRQPEHRVHRASGGRVYAPCGHRLAGLRGRLGAAPDGRARSHLSAAIPDHPHQAGLRSESARTVGDAAEP